MINPVTCFTIGSYLYLKFALLGIGREGKPKMWPCCETSEPLASVNATSARRRAYVENDLVPLGAFASVFSFRTSGAFSLLSSSRLRICGAT